MADADANAHSWEYVGGQAWDSVAEDSEGNLIGSTSTGTDAADIVRRRRRLRARHDAAGGRRVVRDMIRYVYLLIDMSHAMGEKDPALPPGTRLNCTVGLATEFVHKFFDENPISHLGVVILKDGEAEMLTQLSGNPKLHVRALTRASESGRTGGDFSLQNGLEVAGRYLGHMPHYGSREIVVLCAALSTCDPGDLLVETLPRLRDASIRISCISLAAEVYVCRRLAEESNGTMNVCLDKNHYRDLIMAQCTPPPSSRQHSGQDSESRQTCDFVQMGFPTRESSTVPILIHAGKEKKLFARTGYECPRCKAKAFEIPTDCSVCGMKLVLSPHLARSFHHLFPVPPFSEIQGDSALRGKEGEPLPPLSGSNVDSSLLISSRDCDNSCYGCLKYVGPIRVAKDGGRGSKKSRKSPATPILLNMERSLNLRFQCPSCKNIFCADCDAYLHETLHNCPGCLNKE